MGARSIGNPGKFGFEDWFETIMASGFLAIQRGSAKITGESDSKMTINFICNGVVPTHPYFPIVGKIQSFKDLN
ncbi:hypothetical protein JHK82_021918 [Glycine max]|uniref:Uncharacterized protein n=1 Tax=Glycine soja TaxID=3848 RepID=A0A0B2STK4_GLYSO|nr:hypothetical protein JHK87_021842 [Glycine soja]KAG5016248.1 hypothetical protein JHK85_022384 [Glycine max]KAG5026019.1 hypothetical protein JHK86_021933 [Glycine max]KAG5137187.1 hypothetical protein JHK82_021918 [Glycine max]KHN47839.1 hypothetical protein glysoja_029257 [Glycine soja]